MKPQFSYARGATWSCALSLALAFGAQAQIQTPVTVAPAQIVASGATVTVPLATNDAKVRLRLRNGAAYLDEETARREGNSASARLDAEPGLYEIRARSTDKSGAYVAPPLNVIVPGLRREAGVWLFNGSLWIPKAGLAPDKVRVGGTFYDNTLAENNPNLKDTMGPVDLSPTYFLPDLKREGKAKLPNSIPTKSPLNWNVVFASAPTGASALPTPPLGGPNLGFLVQARGDGANFAQSAQNAGERTIILGVNATDPLAATQLQTAAREADAVALKFDGAAPFAPQLWPLKMARRQAEETKDFDLPIFADVSAGNLSDAQLLEIYQDGATGFIAAPGAPAPAWIGAWNDNSNWLLGAVTLEDMGVLPAPGVERLLTDLRQGGRIPLAGQLPDEKRPKGESVMALLGDYTTAADLDGFKKAASEGQTLYLEGLPAPALYGKIGDITGTLATALPAPREDELTLDDPWIWGALRGTELPVLQRVRVTVKKSLAAQTKNEKGMAIETTPRPAGKLSGDPNGWMVCPVGKGRIFWLPHALRDTSNAKLPTYYAAVAGGMQPALVSLSGDAANVRVALRSTSGQTGLLALFNDGDAPAKLGVSVRGDAALVTDLMSGKTIDNTVVGFATQFEVTVAPRAFAWLALARTPQDFDKERAAKRVKGRLK